MSTCTIRTPFHIPDLTSKAAARRAIAQPRTVATVEATATVPDAIDREASNPAANSQILRRWSVAELIAAATSRQEAA